MNQSFANPRAEERLVRRIRDANSNPSLTLVESKGELKPAMTAWQ